MHDSVYGWAWLNTKRMNIPSTPMVRIAGMKRSNMTATSTTCMTGTAITRTGITTTNTEGRLIHLLPIVPRRPGVLSYALVSGRQDWTAPRLGTAGNSTKLPIPILPAPVVTIASAS